MWEVVGEERKVRERGREREVFCVSVFGWVCEDREMVMSELFLCGRWLWGRGTGERD